MSEQRNLAVAKVASGQMMLYQGVDFAREGTPTKGKKQVR